MKTQAIRIGLGVSLRAAVMLIASYGYAQGHSFDVKDCIAMTRFNQPSGLQNGIRAQQSPDGRFFWITTSRGLIDSNQVQSTLWIIDASAVRQVLERCPKSTNKRADPEGRGSNLGSPTRSCRRSLCSRDFRCAVVLRLKEDFLSGENSSAEMQLV